MFLKVSSKISIVLFLLGYNYGIAQTTISVNGTLFERPFQTNVDSELAKNILTNPNDSQVVQLFSDYHTREINTQTLSEITQKYSIDVASLFFVEKLYEQEKNKRAQNYYMSAVDTLTGRHLEQHLAFLQSQNYFIVFVPGLRYKHVNNGGNFLNQRLLLDSARIPYEMIDIEEGGLIETNANIVVNRLQELAKIHNNIIVISVSKGGLETAIALDRLSTSENISSIKAWINVGGILKGTPIADYWSVPIRRGWLACGLFFIGQKVELKKLLNDLSYKQCKEKYKTLKTPAGITTISLIGIPLGQQKKSQIQTPNDGFSPSADSTVEDGIVVVEIGMDHFLKDIDLNSRMVALLSYIVNQLN